MKKNILLALFGAALMFAFVGCAPTEAAPSPDAPAAQTASAEKVKCPECGHEVDKSALKDVHGTMVCVNCAEKHDGTHEANMIDCTCGKQVAMSDAVDVEGKMYCKDCADKLKASNTTPEKAAEPSTGT